VVEDIEAYGASIHSRKPEEGETYFLFGPNCISNTNYTEKCN